MTEQTVPAPEEGNLPQHEEQPPVAHEADDAPGNQEQKPPESEPHQEDQQDQETDEERFARLDQETDDDKADKPLDPATWGTTGHTVADEALRVIQNAGLSTDDAQDLLLDAAMSRDPSKVDLPALTDKIGPRRAKAIMEALQTFSNDMRPRDERISNEVYQYSNGPHALERLLQEGSKKLTASEMQGYVIEIGKGGASAQRAIDRLKSVVSGQAVSLDQKVHMEQYSAPGVPTRPDQSCGITSKTYVASMQALHGPNSRLSFAARELREQELREDRRIGRENGLP